MSILYDCIIIAIKITMHRSIYALSLVNMEGLLNSSESNLIVDNVSMTLYFS